MRGPILLFVAMLGFFLASGCSVVKFAEQEHRVHPLTARSSDFSASGVIGTQADQVVVKAPENYLALNLDVARINVASERNGNVNFQSITIDEVADRNSRNEWVSHLRYRSDQMCDRHKNAIVAGTASTNFVLATSGTLLGGVGALATGGASRLLSAGAGAASATRGHYNEAFLQNYLAAAIVREIDRVRSELRHPMDAGMKRPYDEYGIRQAMVDLGAYHQACSFYKGLVSLTSEVKRIEPIAMSLRRQVDALERSLASLDEQIGRVEKETSASGADAALKTRADRTLLQLQAQRESLRTLQSALLIQEGILRAVAGDASEPSERKGTSPTGGGDQKSTPKQQE